MQDGRHEVLVNEKFDHRQIMAIAVRCDQQAVKDEACPSSLNFAELESCITDQGNSPYHYGDYKPNLVIEGDLLILLQAIRFVLH